MIEKKKCLRCGWEWYPRTEEEPLTCANPKCRSAYWNRSKKVSTVLPIQKVPVNGGYTSVPVESVNWKEEQAKRPEIYGKTLQDKLSELPVERQKRIRKKTAEKIAEASRSKTVADFTEAVEQSMPPLKGLAHAYGVPSGVAPVPEWAQPDPDCPRCKTQQVNRNHSVACKKYQKERNSIQDLDLGKEAPFFYSRPMGCGGPSEGPGSKIVIARFPQKEPVQILDSVSEDLPTDLTYEPFED